jgi:hypothetical protein
MLRDKLGTTMGAAMRAGTFFDVRLSEENEHSVILPSGLRWGRQIPLRDGTPENALDVLRSGYPCSDRLRFDVRRIIGGSIGGFLMDVVCLTGPGGFPENEEETNG